MLCLLECLGGNDLGQSDFTVAFLLLRVLPCSFFSFSPSHFSLDNSPFICYSIFRLAAAGVSVCGIRFFRSFDLGISPAIFPLSPLNAGIEIPGGGGYLWGSDDRKTGEQRNPDHGRSPDHARSRQSSAHPFAAPNTRSASPSNHLNYLAVRPQ